MRYFYGRQVTRGIYTSKVNHTGTYSAILSQNGDFHVAVGDMDIHKVITPDNVCHICQHGRFSVGYKKDKEFIDISNSHKWKEQVN